MLTGWVAGRKASKLKMAGLPETGLATLAGLLGSDDLECASTCCVAPARLADRSLQPGRLHLRSARGDPCFR